MLLIHDFDLASAQDMIRFMTQFRIGEAADLLGVSADTVRRWTDSGKLPAGRDEHGHRIVEGADLAAYLAAHGRVDGASATSSARNRFTGLVTGIKKDTVMAQVEIQAGPHRVVSLLSREALDELGLAIGDIAVAVVKSTTVIVETPR
jgi:molybdopterin-binding protein